MVVGSHHLSRAVGRTTLSFPMKLAPRIVFTLLAFGTVGARAEGIVRRQALVYEPSDLSIDIVACSRNLTPAVLKTREVLNAHATSAQHGSFDLSFIAETALAVLSALPRALNESDLVAAFCGDACSAVASSDKFPGAEFLKSAHATVCNSSSSTSAPEAALALSECANAMGPGLMECANAVAPFLAGRKRLRACPASCAAFLASPVDPACDGLLDPKSRALFAFLEALCTEGASCLAPTLQRTSTDLRTCAALLKLRWEGVPFVGPWLDGVKGRGRSFVRRSRRSSAGTSPMVTLVLVIITLILVFCRTAACDDCDGCGGDAFKKKFLLLLAGVISVLVLYAFVVSMVSGGPSEPRPAPPELQPPSLPAPWQPPPPLPPPSLPPSPPLATLCSTECYAPMELFNASTCSPIRTGFEAASEVLLSRNFAEILDVVDGVVCDQLDVCEHAGMAFLRNVNECLANIAGPSSADLWVCSDACIATSRDLLDNEGCWGDLFPRILGRMPVAGWILPPALALVHNLQEGACAVVHAGQEVQGMLQNTSAEFQNAFEASDSTGNSSSAYLQVLEGMFRTCINDTQAWLSMEDPSEHSCPTAACISLVEEFLSNESTVHSHSAQVIHARVIDTAAQIVEYSSRLYNSLAASGEQEPLHGTTAIKDWLRALRDALQACEACRAEARDAWPEATRDCADAILSYRIEYPNANTTVCPAQCIHAAELVASSECLASMPDPIVPVLEWGLDLCRDADQTVEDLVEYQQALEGMWSTCINNTRTLLTLGEPLQHLCLTGCVPLLEEFSSDETTVTSHSAQVVHTHILDAAGKLVEVAARAYSLAITAARRAQRARRAHRPLNLAAIWKTVGEEQQEPLDGVQVIKDALQTLGDALGTCDACTTEAMTWPEATTACAEAIATYRFEYPNANSTVCPAQCESALDLVASSECLASFSNPVVPVLEWGLDLCQDVDGLSVDLAGTTWQRCSNNAQIMTYAASRCIFAQVAFENTEDCMEACYQSVDLAVQTNGQCSPLVARTTEDLLQVTSDLYQPVLLFIVQPIVELIVQPVIQLLGRAFNRGNNSNSSRTLSHEEASRHPLRSLQKAVDPLQLALEQALLAPDLQTKCRTEECFSELHALRIACNQSTSCQPGSELSCCSKACRGAMQTVKDACPPWKGMELLERTCTGLNTTKELPAQSLQAQLAAANRKSSTEALLATASLAISVLVVGGWYWRRPSGRNGPPTLL